MFRKFLVLGVTAVLAMLVLPAVSANADSVLPRSRVGYCYGIKKAGSHNEVVVTAAGKVNKARNVAGLATLAIANTTQCKHTGNGVPITRITIYSVQLKNSNGSVLARGPQVGSSHRSIVGSATTHRHLACRANLRVFVKVGYGYSDGSYVRPFYIHTPLFKHC